MPHAPEAPVLPLLLTASALATECPFGVNAHLASDDELTLAAEAGVGIVRMDMNWWSIETSQGSYDWGATDRFIDTAASLGLDVFVTIAYTPSWAVGTACNDADPEPLNWCRNRPPAAESYWTNFVAAAVGRYGDRVKYWGLWNEPNLHDFFTGSRDQYVDLLLVPGSDTVRSTCSDCYVLGPDLANLREADWDADEGTCAFGECIFNGWEHSLKEILKVASGSIDIITHHKYADSASELLGELTEGQFLLGVQYMHGVQEITDDLAPGKPVWLTEFGYETTPGGDFSESESAQQLELTYDGAVTLSSWPELETLFWYDLTDDPNIYDWGQFTWGLLDENHDPKEAWYSYRDLIDGYGGCAAFEDDPGDTDTTGGTTSGDDGGTDGGTDDTGDGSTGGTTDPADDTDAPGDGGTTLPGGDDETGEPGEEDTAAAQDGGTSGGKGCTTTPATAGLLLLLPLLLRRTRERKMRGD